MTLGTLYGNVSESNGLYGIGSNVGSTYFEWMIFYDGVTAPVTPLGGSWNFDTNVGTPPAGWTQFFPALPTATMWISMAFIDSRNPTTIVWSTPGLISSPSVYATAYVNTFTQAGTTTVWTLTNDPVTVNNTDVSINGVTQIPGVDYTISGTTLTTTTAAPLNAVILVKYRQALPLSFSADSASIQYVPAGTNAVTTNVQAKLRETLSVKDFGATGNGSNDDTTAIQNCVTAVAALPYGGAVYFPAGNYKITSNITITWPKLVVLQGAGSKLVNILDYRTSVATNGAITYDASSHAGGDDAYMGTWTGGFTLTKSVNQTIVTGLVITSMGTGKGLYVNGVVGGVYKDIAVHGYETNIYVIDGLGFVFRDVYTNQTNYGIYLAGYSSLSGPNAVIIENVIASACNKWGLYINGGMVQVLGGTYSDCGVMATVSGGICQITDPSIGIPKQLTVQAAWFERNRGSADVYINNPVGTTTPVSFSVSNSLFARISSTYHTTNNIYVLNNGNAYLQLDVNNCGFQGYSTSGNTYVASASRKYIAFAGTYSAQCYTSYVANTFNDSTEWPITQVNSVNFSTIGFGSSAGQLVDITGTPTLYTAGNSVGLANATGEVVLDNTAWRPSIPNTFNLGASAYTFKNAYLSGYSQYGASATTYISNSGVNLDLCNTCGVVPGLGISPKANNAQYLGGSALRWSSLYSVLANFSGAITWGAFTIPVPTGSASTFLRNDGTWAAPSSSPPTASFAPTLVDPGQSIILPALPAPTGVSNPALKYEPDVVLSGGQTEFGKWRQYHNAAEWGWGIVYNVPIDPYSVYPPNVTHVRDTANTNKGVCVAQRFDVAEGTSGANFWAIEWAPSSATATAPDWVWGPSMYFYEGSKVADYGVPGSAGGLLRIVSSADRESAIVLDSNTTAGPHSFLMRSTVVGGAIGWALQDCSAFDWTVGPMPKTADGINRIVVGVGADTVTGTTDVIKVYGQLKVFDLGASKGTISCVGNVGFNGLAPLADASRHTGADATDLASAITLVNQLKAILNNCGISLV